MPISQGQVPRRFRHDFYVARMPPESSMNLLFNPPRQQGITDSAVGSLTPQMKKNTGNIMYAYMRNFKMGRGGHFRCSVGAEQQTARVHVNSNDQPDTTEFSEVVG